MLIEKWQHVNVSQKGLIKSGGKVQTKLCITNSINNCCKLKCCSCKKGFWISVNLGRQQNHSVYGITYFFQSLEQLQNYSLLN